MTEKYSISFYNPSGVSQAFVNGFLLFGNEREGRSVSKLASFIRPSLNVFELHSTRLDSKTELIVRDISDVDDPDLSPKLLSLPLPRDESVPPKLRHVGQIIIEEIVPGFKWHDATVIEDIEQHMAVLYSILKKLAITLEKGTKDELSALLKIKHSEMGEVHGLTQQAMDDGLQQGLEMRRKDPEFRVDLAAPDDFVPLLSSDRRIVNARRKSGGHAIKMMDGRRNPGFNVSLAIVGNRWMVMR